MSRENYLTAVGLQEEQVAHLRLLLRRLAPSLAQRWIWSGENNADLVIVDVETFAGRMARDRAGGMGRRCAIVNPNVDLRATELQCALPFTAENVTTLLDDAMAPVANPGNQVPVERSDDFADVLAQFDADGLNMSFHDSRPDYTAAPQSANGSAVGDLGLEAVFAKDKEGDLFRPMRLEVRAGGTTESPDRVSSRNEQRADFKPMAADAKTPPVEYEQEARMLDAWPLRQFLDGDLIGGPSTLQLPDAPALSLDPKNRLCYSNAQTLQELAAYCSQPLPVARWRTLTTLELQQLRGSERERPYSHLIWLIVLLGSHGKLAGHLSPGADFRLTTRPNIDDGIAEHAAIVEALYTPGRLHEIAARSGAGMNEVIDLINAYEAIGWIEAKRYLPPIPNGDSDKGLLGKLRNPFRR